MKREEIKGKRQVKNGLKEQRLKQRLEDGGERVGWRERGREWGENSEEEHVLREGAASFVEELGGVNEIGEGESEGKGESEGERGGEEERNKGVWAQGNAANRLFAHVTSSLGAETGGRGGGRQCGRGGAACAGLAE